MSRAYRWDGEHKTWVARSHMKPRTPAWEAARARRAVRRSGAGMQARDMDGFITKVRGIRTFSYDPGDVDRWLWRQGHQK